jgi:hypothetical protein
MLIAELYQPYLELIAAGESDPGVSPPESRFFPTLIDHHPVSDNVDPTKVVLLDQK